MLPNAETDSDAELAEQILRRGNEQAFRSLYRRHTPVLYRFVLHLLGGRECDAEDVVQDTWLRAMERLPKFRWEASFRTWLCGIGLNCAREALRRAGRSREDASGEIDPVPAARSLATDQRIDLQEALRRLPDGYREVLLLHDLLGLTHEEIARALGVTAGTSRSQLHFARRAVRRDLTQRSTHENRG